MGANQIRNVLVILRFIGVSGREHLRGISTRLANRRLNWNIRFVLGGDRLTSDDLEKIGQSHFDGIIVADMIEKKIENLIANSRSSIVTLDSGRGTIAKRTFNASHIWLDNVEIGALAAKELASLGQFRSFAYISFSITKRWSMRRETGFRANVPTGIPVFIFNAKGQPPVSDELRAWLVKLPKPVAVMGAYDSLAAQAIECCNAAGLSVPDQVAIVGVDNETTICDSTSPSLTSIELDRCSEGQKAVDELDRLMRARKKPRAKNILLRQSKLVKRDSTSPIAPSASLVSRCLAYVNREAPNIRSVADVADFLGVSRRLLEIRVRDNVGKTIHELIVARRLHLAESLLRQTNYSIDLISEKCGYGQSARLKYIFKAAYGLSMREWRKKNSSQAKSGKSS